MEVPLLTVYHRRQSFLFTRHDVSALRTREALPAVSRQRTHHERAEMAKEARAGAPEDRIRSIYAARSAASGASSGGDFAGIKTSDPDRSLRAAYLSHLSKPAEAVPREGGGLTETVLRRAYVAHIKADAGSR